MEKTNETGRSMVETIAVLAIIGIITVGGLAGFRTAMNKLNANKVIEAASQVSTEAQLQSSGCIDQDNLDDFEMPPCVSEIKGASNGQVKITFSNNDECATIESLVGNTLGTCKWDKKSAHTYYYIPNRGKKCPCPNPENGCPPCLDECETYTPASCL